MTLVPNLLATGILTTAAALALGVWSVGHAGRRHGGLVLIALSVLLLLVGGGFGPPLVGVIVGLAGLSPRCRHTPDTGTGPAPAWQLWPWWLATGVAGFLALMPGTVLLYELFEVNSEGLVYTFAAVAFGGLALALPEPATVAPTTPPETVDPATPPGVDQHRSRSPMTRNVCAS